MPWLPFDDVLSEGGLTGTEQRARALARRLGV
jgi:hypothetical protein